MTRALILVLCAKFLRATAAIGGYEQPCHIDGCQSINVRFVITPERVRGKLIHKPNKWRFHWKDTKEK